jgi:GT2 family glycosyltransferase
MAAVAVIIVNYNAGQMLARCLNALKRQTFRDFRTILVDNASSDGSADAIETRFSDVTVVRSHRNLGFAAANNLGLVHAQNCPWVALLNPDAFAEPNWLESFMRASERHSEYVFFGCLMRDASSSENLDGTGDVYHVSGLSWRRDRGVAESKATMEAGEIFGPCAAAALYRQDILEEVGGFDERFFCYIEDIDLAFRLRLRGHRCWYVPEAVVHHVGSGITGKQSDFSVYHGHRNMVWTFFKNMPVVLLCLYLPLHVIANLAGLAKHATQGRFRVVLRAKLDALKGLPAMLGTRGATQRARSVDAWSLRKSMARGIGPLIHRR